MFLDYLNIHNHIARRNALKAVQIAFGTVEGLDVYAHLHEVASDLGAGIKEHTALMCHAARLATAGVYRSAEVSEYIARALISKGAGWQGVQTAVNYVVHSTATGQGLDTVGGMRLAAMVGASRRYLTVKAFIEDCYRLGHEGAKA